MEILIVLLVISNLSLVLTDDAAVSEKPVAAAENSYKVHPETEDNDLSNDQVAESSQAISHSYANAVVSDRFKEIQAEVENQKQSAQQQISANTVQHGLRQNSIVLSPIHVIQQSSHQGYVQPQQTQQLLIQQYPTHQVQILGAEASPLHGNENPEALPQALGYTSYIEHVSKKDEEEIKSALKEGSVSDIKRLVPKSGISFTIYQKEKNLDSQNSETQSNQVTHFSAKAPTGFSSRHHKIRHELPATQIRVQTEVHQTRPLEELHSSLKNENVKEHHVSEYSQKLLHSLKQEQQNRNAQTVYYTQPETHKTYVELNEKSSYSKPHYKINLPENNYNRQSTGAELHRNLKSSIKSSKNSYLDVNNQKHWNLNGKVESYQKAVKPLKTLDVVHYNVDPVAQAEVSKGATYTQNQGTTITHDYSKPKTESAYVQTTQGSGNYVLSSSLTNINQNYGEHLVNVPYSEQQYNNLQNNYANVENAKQGQVISQLGTTAITDQYAAVDSEAAKSNHQTFISQIPKSSYVETKNIQNFDHKKALEGSTTFDIKNAIDSSGTLLHQQNYINPQTTDIHSVENLQKQQLTYIVPQIPTSNVVVDNNIPEDHQTKQFEHLNVSPQVTYQHTAEVGGKFLYPPQTIQWTAEHLKQGINTKEIHPQVLRFHLPKEELYVKTQNAQFPHSVAPQIALPQYKQPFVLHYDLPLVRHVPQELYFQQKTKTRPQINQINQVGHYKLAQPVGLDWSLFRSGQPTFGVNTISVKPELVSHVGETGKKIVPILVRKRKNRSNGNQEAGVVYGKVTVNRRPSKPTHRQEKNVRVNLLPEASNNIKQYEMKGDRKNEFSVSASYKVDRSTTSS